MYFSEINLRRLKKPFRDWQNKKIKKGLGHLERDASFFATKNNSGKGLLKKLIYDV